MVIFACFLKVDGRVYKPKSETYPFETGTTTPRKRRGNSTAYCTRIRFNRSGQRVYQETQTFDRKQVGQAWMKRREAELTTRGAMKRITRKSVSIKQVIDRCFDELEMVIITLPCNVA
ncbi:Chorismate mutase protein [Pseudomonas caricapapayae]|uniref:Chorismate mutase protein n=1 Tax=Pseudomonas caricapapayae TaxID=46678 RepID=A0A3M6F3L4_9PSED|nr:chorismate mutase [Pseudomonas caricapapayae]RMV74444.1 Chorismate mutase protein [Pseudomonas caricapapayae]